jgi:hypothetical protein
MPRALIALLTAAALLAAPAVALAQSAGDEQYTDPFQGGDGGGQEQPAQQREQPVEPAPTEPAEPAPTEPAEPAPGGNGTAEAAPSTEGAPTADAAQDGSAALPRTGGPVVLVGAIGYALLLAGIAIRRKA